MKKWVKVTIAAVLASLLVLSGLAYAATWSPKWMIAYAAITNQKDENVTTSTSHVELSLAMPQMNAPAEVAFLKLLDGLLISADGSIDFQNKHAVIEEKFQFKPIPTEGELAAIKPIMDTILDENNAFIIRLKMDPDALYLQIPTKLLKDKNDLWVKFEKKDLELVDPKSGPAMWDAIQKLVFTQTKSIKVDTIRDFGRDASDIMVDSISQNYANVRAGEDAFRTVEFSVKNNNDVQTLTSEVVFKALPTLIDLIQARTDYRDFIISQIKDGFSSQLDLLSEFSTLNPEQTAEDVEMLSMEPNTFLYTAFHGVSNDIQKKPDETPDMKQKYTDEQVNTAFSTMLTDVKNELLKPEIRTDFDHSMTDLFKNVTFKDLTLGMDLSMFGEITKQHMHVAVDIKDGETVMPLDMDAFTTNQYNQAIPYEVPAKTVNISDIMSKYDTIFDLEKIGSAIMQYQGIAP